MNVIRAHKYSLDHLDMANDRFTANGRLTVTPEDAAANSSLTCFSQPAGENHYRLLAHLSYSLPGRTLLDIGTYQGMSALALAASKESTVVSYDIVNELTRNFSDLDNLDFVIGDILRAGQQHQDRLRDAALVFFDISPHSGADEYVFYRHLVDVGFGGIALFDDIYLNPGMRDFWTIVCHPKSDLTSVGHNTGTGAVFFGEDRIEVAP